MHAVEKISNNTENTPSIAIKNTRLGRYRYTNLLGSGGKEWKNKRDMCEISGFSCGVDDVFVGWVVTQLSLIVVY
jgi:hypothetical protein